MKFPYFTTSSTLETKTSNLTKSTLTHIVMVSDKYELWVCLQSHLQGCLVHKKDATEFYKVFIANGKYDIGRCILIQSK